MGADENIGCGLLPLLVLVTAFAAGYRQGLAFLTALMAEYVWVVSLIADMADIAQGGIGYWKSQVLKDWSDVPDVPEVELGWYDKGLNDGDVTYGDTLRSAYHPPIFHVERNDLFFSTPAVAVRVAGRIAYQMAVLADGESSDLEMPIELCQLPLCYGETSDGVGNSTYDYDHGHVETSWLSNGNTLKEQFQMFSDRQVSTLIQLIRIFSDRSDILSIPGEALEAWETFASSRSREKRALGADTV